ncbi:MAG: sulfotransferase, partial [Gammaproteobacteria bacterium]
MPLEVIGAGFGRTGTLSLKQVLERLGFNKCYHMMELFGHPGHVAEWRAAHRGAMVDWSALYAGYRAT